MPAGRELRSALDEAQERKRQRDAAVAVKMARAIAAVVDGGLTVSDAAQAHGVSAQRLGKETRELRQTTPGFKAARRA